MKALAIIEDFYVIEDLSAGLLAGGELGPVDGFQFESAPEANSRSEERNPRIENSSKSTLRTCLREDKPCIGCAWTKNLANEICQFNQARDFDFCEHGLHDRLRSSTR